jgi:hypothetical protein
MDRDRLDEIMHYRIKHGADALELMGADEVLPLPNIQEVVTKMQEYYEKHLKEFARKRPPWIPTEHWWLAHMKEIRSFLRKQEKLFFECVSTHGIVKEWKFVTKEEYDRCLVGGHRELGTRIENHNEKIEDGKKKWSSLNLPMIEPVPLLTEKHGKR